MNIPYKAYCILISLYAFSALKGSEQLTVICEKAQSTDAACLDSLMLTEGINDKDKIVILPNKFRKKSIQSAIEQDRIFVARCNQEIVGYKKLYLLSNAEECADLLRDEIRCVNGSLIDYSLHVRNGVNQYARCNLAETSIPTYTDTALYIYDGADFTKATFRGKGINQDLTNKAFSMVQECTQRHIEETQASRLILVYGLTHLNDYNDRGEGKSRTPSIVSSFASFISTLTGTYPDEIRHYRYKAFMPTFDLEAQECIPNSDSEAVPGYGNVLEVTLPLTTLKEQS